MPLSADIIRAAASNGDVFARGLQYAEHGRVLSWSARENAAGRRIDGRVEGGDIYRTVAWLDQGGAIVDHDCECPAHALYDGLCKHLVAMLYKVCLDQGAPARPQAAHARPLRTDAFASLLITRRAARERAVAEALALPDDRRVSLVPRLMLAPSSEGVRPSLQLSVGIGRKYVVKSVGQFAEDVNNLTHVSYGKELAFTHVPERFDDASRPLLQFVLDQCDQVR
ncbi:MAG: hypothetical protein GX558_07090, partial [Clostridiales bacterium]|nr:hypothetical protein [Clostridiales bacterium]